MIIESSITRQVHQAIEAGEGLLRLAPTWVPRSYLVPGRRLKLDSRDLYAYGADRGGIDERWIASTTMAMNENRTPDEGLSFVDFEGERFTLKDAVEEAGERIVGKEIWNRYHRWPVYSKFFDNIGPIPHHLHQSDEQAQLVGQRREARRLLLSSATECDLRAIFRTLTSGWSLGQRRKTFATVWRNWNNGDNGILRSCEGLSPTAWNWMAGATASSARAGFVADLRAAMGKRRAFHVPVHSLMVVTSNVNCWCRTFRNSEHDNLDLSGRHGRLGTEHRREFQEQALH